MEFKGIINIQNSGSITEGHDPLPFVVVNNVSAL